jgi:DNA-binding NarL/FixJ family response regulator
MEMNVLIVDDNIAYRNSLKDFLENKLGHKVIGVASSGEEFLEMASSFYADIILMDIEMSGINGIQASHRMNILQPSAKIIAITMHVEKVFLIQLVSNGFRGCVYKSEIFDKLETAMNMAVTGQLYFPKDIKIG